MMLILMMCDDALTSLMPLALPYLSFPPLPSHTLAPSHPPPSPHPHLILLPLSPPLTQLPLSPPLTHLPLSPPLTYHCHPHSPTTVTPTHPPTTVTPTHLPLSSPLTVAHSNTTKNSHPKPSFLCASSQKKTQLKSLV